MSEKRYFIIFVRLIGQVSPDIAELLSPFRVAGGFLLMIVSATIYMWNKPQEKAVHKEG